MSTHELSELAWGRGRGTRAFTASYLAPAWPSITIRDAPGQEFPVSQSVKANTTHQIQRASRLEPLDLALVEGVRERDVFLSAVGVLDAEREVLAGREGLEAEDRNTVVGADLVVVGGVGEGEREHTLLLQVRLVDARKRACDDRQPAQEARLERSVLARRALAVVVVADDDPLDAVVAVVRRDLRHAAPLARDLVLDLVRLAVLGVDRADEAVLRDVLEVTTVLQPGTASRDVIRR